MTDCNDEIDCRMAVQKLWDYLDEELTPERMTDMRHHLEECGDCLPHHDFARVFLAALSTARESEARAPDALRHRVMETLRAAGLST
jgi:mycothiol system anti-sigma-R factor